MGDHNSCHLQLHKLTQTPKCLFLGDSQIHALNALNTYVLHRLNTMCSVHFIGFAGIIDQELMQLALAADPLALQFAGTSGFLVRGLFAIQGRLTFSSLGKGWLF